MNKTKRILGIAGLSAIFATTLVLTITLPITIYNNKDSENSKYFKGLNTTTDYLVGNAIKLNVTNVTDPDSYDYIWYMQSANSQNLKRLENVSGSSISLNNAQLDWNEATVYCALVKKIETNPIPQNFLVNKTTSGSDTNNEANTQITDADVVMWTSTKLVLSEPFSVSNCQVNINQTDVTNGVVLDSKNYVIIVPQNNGVTLTATAQINSNYSQYVHYTWYKNGVAIPNANTSSLSLTSNDLKSGDQYYCSVQLISGPSTSNVAKSATYKVNVVG